MHNLANMKEVTVNFSFWCRKHIYSNHADQAELQLSRPPHPFPTLRIRRKPASIFDYEYDDFAVEGYVHHPAIKAPVAV